MKLRILFIFFACVLGAARCASAQVQTLTSEGELLKVLAAEGDQGDKALACKRLAVYGSEASVDELSKLLSDPQLASWARIALEAIPGEASNVALRKAAGELDGMLLVGVLNSLGVRRDVGAVELLAGQLNSDSLEVASAAAYSLGKIGSREAATTLRHFLDTAPSEKRSAVAEAAIVAAHRVMSEGDSDSAAAIFDFIRTSNLPVQRIVEATRGAILARGEDGIELLVEQLRSPNKKLLAVGLQTARELGSDHVGPALVGALADAPSDRAALIVEALGDLPGQVDLKALEALASSGSQDIRLAAISVLGRVGDSTCVEPLLAVARTNSDLQAAVRATLVAIGDEKVNAEILKRLPTAEGDKLILLELVGLRQLEATDELVRTLDHSDVAIRGAALQALGETVPQDQLSVLAQQVMTPKRPEDVGAAARALRAAAVRMPDREACAMLLSEALAKAPNASKADLLSTIAAVGGSTALQTLADYAKGSDDALRDASTRLLGEWMTIDVAPVLLDLAKTGPADRFQVRSLRGYIRVARQFVMADEDRVQMCSEALNTARSPVEQKLVLDILKRYPSVGMLKLAIGAISTPGIESDARKAAQEIGGKLADHADAQQLLKDAGL